METSTKLKRQLIREQTIKHADTYEKALMMRHKIHKSKLHQVRIDILDKTIHDSSISIAKKYDKTFKIENNHIKLITEVSTTKTIEVNNAGEFVSNANS